MTEKIKEKYKDASKEDLLKIIEKLEARKKYGLIWDEDKVKEQFEKDSRNALPVLKEVAGKEIKKDSNGSTNILIEGDNYHALSVLNFTHLGKIDVIYIDPPYNTGNKDFIYNDEYINLEDSYRHSKWLTFMAKRLRLAKKLLSENGIIFISIDNNEYAQLKLLCDEILVGYVTTLHVQMSTAQGQKIRSAKKGNLVKNAEYVLVYSKNEKKSIGKRLLHDPALYDNHYSKFLVNIKKDTYKEVDLEEVLVNQFKKELESVELLNKGRLSKKNIASAYSKIDKIKKFIHENSKNIVRVHDSISIDEDNIRDRGLLKSFKGGHIINYETKNRSYLIGKDLKSNKINQRISLEGKINKCDDFYNTYGVSTIRGDWWPGFYLDMGNVSKEGGVGFSNGKKPIRLIEQLIYLVANPDSVVLDFFAGSGSTGHAVINLNQKYNWNLKFILNTHNEENGSGKIVDKYCYPRLSNVFDEQKYFNLKYFKTGFVKKTINKDDMKIKLTRECTEMLCLREGVFNKKKKTDDFAIFEQGGRIMAVYYSIERGELKKLKKELDRFNGDKVLYCFTLDPLGLDKNDFVNWEDIQLEPIPQKILDIYEEIYEY